MPNQLHLKKTRIVSGLIFVLLVSFGIYIFTLNPSVSLRDGAELTTACVSLGIPHSPGYPLFVLSGHAFSNIPLANPAYRINVMNAFFASISIALLFYACLLCTGSIISSIIASLSVAITLSYWVTATGTEVFSLNTAFLALLWVITLVFLLEKQKNHAGLLYLFAFVSGFGLGDHHLLLGGIFSCGLILTIELFRRKIRINILALSSFFVLGFSVYLFLLIRAKIDPFLNFGDPGSLENLFSVITRKQYGSLKLSTDKSVSLFSPDASLILWYFSSLVSEFSIIIFLFGIAGFFVLAKRDKRVCSLFSIQFLLYGIGFLMLAGMRDSEKTRSILDRFFHLSYFPFGVFVAAGINSAPAIFKNKKINLSFAVCILFLAISFSARLPVMNLISRNNYFQLEVAGNLAKTLKKNALVLTQADAPQYALLYDYVVENKRQDIIPISSFLHDWRVKQIEKRMPGLIPRGMYQSSKEIEKAIIESNIITRPVFLAGGLEKSAARQMSGVEIIPAGLTLEVIRKGSIDILDSINNSSNLMKYIYSYRANYSTALYEKSYFIREIISKYASQHFDVGQHYFQNRQYGQALNEFLTADCIYPDSPEDSALIEYNIGLNYSLLNSPEEAVKHYSRAIFLNPGFAQAYYSLGELYIRQKETEKGKEALMKALDLNPNYEKARAMLK